MKRLVLVATLCLMTACTQPGEKTGYASVAGGVIGAGLGAIVGNQVGSPGAGLAIGMAAGAGAGAAIGNAIEENDNKIASHEERLQRQEESLRAQRAELASLRTVDRDSSVKDTSYAASSMNGSKAWNKEPSNVRYANTNEVSQARAQLNTTTIPVTRAASNTYEKPSYEKVAIAPAAQNSIPKSDVWSQPTSKSSVRERDLVVDSMPQKQENKPSIPVQAASLNVGNSNEQCQSADAEMQKASQVSDSADKLFHIRRALRLCPDKSQYHAELGNLYASMNRGDDARFEYNEALKFDPSSDIAQHGLESLQRGTSSSATQSALAKTPKLPSSVKGDRY